MTRRSRTYLWQSVIGLGFLSGVWMAIGIDPEEVVLNTIGTAITAAYPDPALRALFLALPTLLLLVSVYGAWKNGRVMGLIAVILACAAGLSIFVSLPPALLLLLLAIVAGYLATNRRMVRKFTGR